MATLASLVVKLGLDAKDLDSGLDKVEKDSGRIGSVLSKIGPVAAAGIGAAGVAVVGLGVTAFNTAREISGATNEIAAGLGLTRNEAEGFEDVMKGVFRNNFGDNFADIGEGVVHLDRNLGGLIDTTGDAGQTALESAFALRDSFGVDVADSMSTVRTLMDEFGLSSDQAFDFVSKGFQEGLDRSGDFLDSINEYSTQFSEGGANAAQFFSLMKTGLAGGALGTDKAADAFKEFRVRIQDGSDTTKEALDAIGISSEDLFKKMADGMVTPVEAFDMVLEALYDVDDQNVLMQAGVDLMGNQFEDLGQSAVLGLELFGTSMQEMVGSTDALNQRYENLGAVVSGTWRRIQVALVPAGEAMLELANQIMPHLSDFISGTLAPAIESVSGLLVERLPGAISTMSEVFDTVRFAIGEFQAALEGVPIEWFDTLEGLGLPANVTEALATLIEQIIDMWQKHGERLIEVSQLAWNVINEVVDLALTLIRTLVDLFTSDTTTEIDGWLGTLKLLIETAWETYKILINAALDQIVNILELALAILRGDWETAWDEVGQILSRAWQSIHDVIKLAGPVILEVTKSIVLGVRDAFTSIDWGAVGRGMMEGIKGGITSMAGSLANAARETAKSALDSVKGFLGIGSPSKLWMTEIGIPIIEGVIRGIEIKQADLIDASVKALRGATRAASDQLTNAGAGAALGGVAGGVRLPTAGDERFAGLSPVADAALGINAQPAGQTWNVTINSSAPVSTIRSDVEMLKALANAI